MRLSNSVRKFAKGLLLGSTGLVVTFLAFLWWCPDWAVVEHDGSGRVDWIVVPGGDPTRAAFAAAVYNRGEAGRVLVSGRGDAIWCRETLIENGVPADLISLESMSASTFENAGFAEPILRKSGARRVAVVTSWYHSRRTLACFRHQVKEIEFIAVSVPKNYQRTPYEMERARLEIIKTIFYALSYDLW